VADLTQDEAIDRARVIDVESYDVFLDLTAEPVLSGTEIGFRWLRPDASTFAELCTQGVRGVTLDGVTCRRRRTAGWGVFWDGAAVAVGTEMRAPVRPPSQEIAPGGCGVLPDVPRPGTM
jgi:hypothetical protein